MYRVGVRMLRKRDEHHRLQNDSVKGVKAENLWGPGCRKNCFVDSCVSLNVVSFGVFLAAIKVSSP